MKQITWICIGCGLKHCPDPKRIYGVSTFHKGKCDACGKTKSVTQGRDYGVYEIN